MQDLTDLTDLCEKVENIDFSTFHSKSVESCMNGWTDLQVDLCYALTLPLGRGSQLGLGPRDNGQERNGLPDLGSGPKDR